LKMLEHAAERAAQGRLDSERNEASLNRAREKRIKTTRPKSRRREQGTEVKLCPLRFNTTEGALRRRRGSTRQRTGRRSMAR